MINCCRAQPDPVVYTSSSPGSTQERDGRQAQPAVNDFITQVAGIRGRASTAVRSQAEPGNEILDDNFTMCRYQFSQGERESGVKARPSGLPGSDSPLLP